MMPGQPTSLSFWGINGYFGGYERLSIPNEMETLLPKGRAMGLQWTREEFVWANIEPSQGAYQWDIPDDRLWFMAKAGYGVVGMILTTPPWARKPSCAGNYWCPPQDVNDFANFVSAIVERYDADGQDDSAGHPRVDYWEIWNEPNHAATWPGTPAEYGDLLIAGYNAVKQADPTARVLVGGIYVFDGTAGLAFLNQVLQSRPAAWNAFDVLSIHPYMPDAAPDAPGSDDFYLMLARLQRSKDWVDNHGGGKPVWVTEVGWSTCTAGDGDCDGGFAKTADQQANYLIRTQTMALAKGIEHLSLFQLEDKFDGGQSTLWGGCAILGTVDQGYRAKTAYTATTEMITQLTGTTYLYPGPKHELYWTWRDGGRHLDAQTRFDYRFGTPDGGYVDVIWRPDEQDENLKFPVLDNMTVTWVERDGQTHTLTPSEGFVSFTVNGRPGYLRQEPAPPPPPSLELSPTRIGFLSEAGGTPSDKLLHVRNSGSGTLTWALSLTSGTQWFTATPIAGTAPSTVTVQAIVPMTGTGDYTGTLSVDAGAAGQGQVDLWLRLVDQLQHIYLPLTAR
jgi:hypothetical protein